MNKSKLSVIMMSLLAITSLASCNNTERRSKSNSEQPTSDISSNNPGSSSSDDSGDAELVSISLNKANTEILLGSTETLTVAFNPSNAKDKTVVWSSEDASVASVENGVVTANKIGTTVIKVASQGNAAINASCTVKVVDNVVLSNVDAKHEFVMYNTNKAKDSAGNDGFYDHNQSYKVGDDNAFNVKPELTVLDAETYLPVSASKWLHDFNITATLDGTTVGDTYFSVVDPFNCDVKFTEAAVGKTFTINIVPNGISASQVTRFTRSFTVEVVDGYNVYNAKELGYFDTREANSTEDSFTLEDNTTWQCKWTEFKAANGMDPNLHPEALILHKDLKVTTADLPSNFFYTQAEATAIGDAAAAGSLHDRAYFYLHTTDGSITVDGNYFELDFSEIPLVTRENHKPTAVGAVVSHSAAFKADRGNDIKFQNINMTGNAKNAVTDDDKIYGGGFIFVKGAGSRALTAYNIIAAKFFITFMGEKPHYEDCPSTRFLLDKTKCFDNYNSFLYNWGSEMNIRNTLFRSCGGPVVIQDHTGTDDYEEEHGWIVYGKTSSTIFEDCTVENYVSGNEAWFQQFNATGLVPKIKGMSDLLGNTGLPKGFVVNENKEGKFYMELATQQQKSYWNFIALNKSGSAEGMTSVPACGVVKFIHSGNELTYDYRQPDQDPVIQAYLAYSADPSDANAQALGAAALAKGVAINPQPQTPEDMASNNTLIQAYITAVSTPHGCIRTFNGTYSAPVFDLGPQFDLLSIASESATQLSSAYDLAAGNPAIYAATAEQKAAMPNECAIYFNGMMLVFGLTPYVA